MSQCSSLLSENLGGRKGENIPFRGPPWGVGVGVILLWARPGLFSSLQDGAQGLHMCTPALTSSE